MKLKETIDTIIDHNAQVSIFDFKTCQRVFKGMMWETPKEILEMELVPLKSWFPFSSNDQNKGHLIIEVK